MSTTIAYFVHDLNDAAVARRVTMFQAAGATVRVAGFRRRAAPDSVVGAPVTDLGLTADAALGARALSVVRHVLRRAPLRRFATGADVIVARNLETLAIAAAIRRPGQRLVYECLDIHRKMAGDGMASRVLRGIERALLGRVDLIITSSPAFVTHHFDANQRYRGPVLLVENKLLVLDGDTPPPPDATAERSAPWRIGWFGMLRCHRSLALLRGFVAGSGGRIAALLAGRPSYTEFADFDRDVADVPGLQFEGPYRPADLATLYARTDFVWCIDFFEEGLNSRWLLSNRLYEGLAHGGVPIALAGTEIAAWLTRANAGIILDGLENGVPATLNAMTAAEHARLRARTAAIPRGALVATRADCDALVAAVAGVAA